MNIRIIIIMTICMISPVAAYAMEQRQINPIEVRDHRVWQERLQAFRTQNRTSMVIIHGVLYMDPASPEALAARAKFEEEQRQREEERQRLQQQRLEQQRLEQQRLEQQRLERIEQELIHNYAFQPLSTNSGYEEFYDNRSQQSSTEANKENPRSVAYVRN